MQNQYLYCNKVIKYENKKFVPGDYFLLEIAKKKFEIQRSNCDDSVDFIPPCEVIPSDFFRLHELPQSSYAPQVIYVRA